MNDTNNILLKGKNFGKDLEKKLLVIETMRKFLNKIISDYNVAYPEKVLNQYLNLDLFLDDLSSDGEKYNLEWITPLFEEHFDIPSKKSSNTRCVLNNDYCVKNENKKCSLPYCDGRFTREYSINQATPFAVSFSSTFGLEEDEVLDYLSKLKYLQYYYLAKILAEFRNSAYGCRLPAYIKKIEDKQ